MIFVVEVSLMGKWVISYEDAHKLIYRALKTPISHDIDVDRFGQASEMLTEVKVKDTSMPEWLPKGQVKEYDNGMVAMNKETYKEYEDIASLQAIRSFNGKLQMSRFKKSVREEVWGKFKGHCAYCGKPLKYKDMQIDHMKPKHLGGTDDIDNLFPACRRCNFYKSTFTIEKFRENVQTIPTRLMNVFIFKVGVDYGFFDNRDQKVLFYFEKVKANEYSQSELEISKQVNEYIESISEDTGVEFYEE